MGLHLDIHVLQTLPPNNLNRDDTGSPKTAIFGGVPRQRVSSQAWKRAIRKDFANYLDPSDLGVRTKRVIERIAYKVLDLQGVSSPDASNEEHRTLLLSAARSAEDVLKAAKFKPEKKSRKGADDAEQLDDLFSELGYLLFLSEHQITRVAEAIIADPEKTWKKSEVTSLLDEAHSVDVAMFGRMVADAPDYNVEAAVQVAHAIGVSASEPEFDYYTAVDDVAESAEETGAGMIGTVAYMSSTLYRYATVNVPALKENLGSEEAARRAVDAFVRAFITSMPTGKQNTFANNTMPDVVVVSLRDDRPISFVNAFETPVSEGEHGGRRATAARRMAEEMKALTEMYDAPALKTWVLRSASVGNALDSAGTVVNRTQLLEDLAVELEGTEA